MQEFEFNEYIMGTDLSVSIITKKASQAKTLFEASLARLQEYEQQFSRFLPTSELSRLNTERTLIVSPFFLELILIARTLYEKTGGYFNPLLQIDRFGYSETYEEVKQMQQTKNLTPYSIDFSLVTIDTDTRRISLARDERLDFGGFLKGHLAEMEAKRIYEEGLSVRGVIVNIGGDIHTRGVDEQEKPFVFEIKNPIHETPIAIVLQNQSLATSGTYNRTWIADMTPMHHILARDGTQNPESDIVSASVIHEHGADAEAYAKTLLSLSPTMLENMIQEQLTFVTIKKDGTINKNI